MKKSEEIRFRIEDAGDRYFACDNIADHIDEDDRFDLIHELAEAFEVVLDRLLIDWRNDPNSQETPFRLAKMYFEETMSGRYNQPDIITTFPNEGEHSYKGMLVVRAEITSMCAHHHQPMKGVAYIGIIPNHKVMGLSKYIRIAQWVAKRGTLQEELCNMIASEIMKVSGTQDVAVYIAATHGCVENRGVRAHSSLTQTTVLHGRFQEDPACKEEFYKNITLQETYTGGR